MYLFIYLNPALAASFTPPWSRHTVHTCLLHRIHTTLFTPSCAHRPVHINDSMFAGKTRVRLCVCVFFLVLCVSCFCWCGLFLFTGGIRLCGCLFVALFVSCCCVCDLFLLLHRYHYDFTPIADVASKPEHTTHSHHTVHTIACTPPVHMET